MSSSDAANRPRWRGQPGFYEIWFLVVFEPAARRAWWFRYTTFAATTGPARATLWAAAFDATAVEPAVGLKAILPAGAWDAGPPDRFAIRLGDAELTNGTARGAVETRGRRIAWDLRFTPEATAARRAPWLLDHLPLPTHAAHANSEVACEGWVSVDGVRRELARARAVQKHIWGTRRVEELFWLYCPRFAEDASACLEATAVRPRLTRGTPRLTMVWLQTADGTHDATGLAALPGNHVLPSGGARLELRSVSATRRLRATAWCEPRTLVGWDYRDPSGWNVHVAQSDLASCVVELRTRPHPLAPWGPPKRLTAEEGAALEFHGPDPLPGVRYLGWDETG